MQMDRPLTRLADGPYFVAHREELDQLSRCLRDGLNVVITGPAGSGKTSLAAQIASPRQQHGVYATGTSSAAELAEAIAEDIVGPLSRRRHRHDEMMASVLGPLQETPTDRGRIVSSVERVARDFTQSLQEPDDSLEPLIVVDHVSYHAAASLFNHYSDLLSRVPAVWVVCVQPDILSNAGNPAPSFFDEHIMLGPPSRATAIDVVASRTGLSSSVIEARMPSKPEDALSLRSLVVFARQLSNGTSDRGEDLNAARRAAQATLADLGRPAAMLVAVMQGLGPVSASDSRLLEQMGWKRARASEVLSQLRAAGLVSSTEQRGPDGGRPRRVYELVSALTL